MTLTLFAAIGTSSSGTYDPWIDTNDDGRISMDDIIAIVDAFGTTGTAINKTELLLELESRLDSLNATVLDQMQLILELETGFAELEAALNTRMAELNASVTGFNSTLQARIPKKDVITVSCMAFLPTSPSSTYSKGIGLFQGSGYFYAWVQLPSNVTVTNMTVKLTDSTATGYMSVTMMRLYNSNVGWSNAMATVSTTASGTPGSTVLYDNTIITPTVDNQNFSYIVEAILSENVGNLMLHWVQIEFEFPA
jgi:hypothetical protein